MEYGNPTSGLLRAVVYTARLASNGANVLALFVLAGGLSLLREPYAYQAAETAQPAEWAITSPPAISGALCAATVAGLMWVWVVRRLRTAQPVTLED